MEDFAVRNKDYALYLPSIQHQSALAIISGGTELSPNPLPAGLTADDFNWLDSNNRFWHYHATLASAARFKDISPLNAVTHRSASTILLGDSGGYQIGTGALGETKDWKGKKYTAQKIIDAWKASNIKHELLSWLDANATLAMSIDMPLWALKNEKSPFSNLSKQELLDLSADNLRFMDAERNREFGCRILNVLQAHGDLKIREDGGKSSEASEEECYQTVKAFPFEGWALAGEVGSDGGLYRILRRILLLRDEGFLDAPRSWIHILKLSPCRWSPILTQIQRAVRKDVNEQFRLSYDSSTPYNIAGVRSQHVSLPAFGDKLSAWRLPKHKFPTGITAATKHRNKRLNSKPNKHLLAPLNSPIAQLFTIGDLLKDGRMVRARAGRLAQEVLINHNVYTYTLAGIMANEIAFGKNTIVPKELRTVLDLVPALFVEENWQDLLRRNRGLLEKIKR